MARKKPIQTTKYTILFLGIKSRLNTIKDVLGNKRSFWLYETTRYVCRKKKYRGNLVSFSKFLNLLNHQLLENICAKYQPLNKFHSLKYICISESY